MALFVKIFEHQRDREREGDACGHVDGTEISHGRRRGGEVERDEVSSARERARARALFFTCRN